MDITLGELNKLPIKRLKAILKKLIKEPKNVENIAAINIINNLIRDKKRKDTILHPEFIKCPHGMIRSKKCRPIHLT